MEELWKFLRSATLILDSLHHCLNLFNINIVGSIIISLDTRMYYSLPHAVKNLQFVIRTNSL
jgi:hypothetical protein